jgi:cell division protein FtsQ
MTPTATSPASTARRTNGADPRIIERRQHVESDRRRRRRRLLASVLLAASGVAGMWMLTQSHLLDVDAIDIVGTSNLGTDEALALSGIAYGDPLFRLDTSSAVAALRSHPWVADASVRRSWVDGRVVVTIEERLPVAAVASATGDAVALVDASGQVLAVEADSGGLPIVTGVIAGAPGTRLDPVDRGVVIAASAIPPGLATRVTTVTPGATGEINLLLGDGPVVVLGGIEDLTVKITTVQTVLATVDMQCVTIVDVALADTAVLTRGESCT